MAQAVILAAGKSVRMRTDTPKVLHRLCGRPVLAWVAAALTEAGVDTLHVVAPPEHLEAVDRLGGGRWIVHPQPEPRGTAHALSCAAPAFAEGSGPVLVVPGDAPLVRAASLRRLLDSAEQAPAAVLTAILDDPAHYGRVVRDGTGRVQNIVEARDADEDQLLIDEINSGMYRFAASDLRQALPALGADNAQEEFYLTDLLRVLHEAGRAAAAVEVEDESEVLGINTRAELADAEWHLQERVQAAHMAAGVTITAPWQTYIEADVAIGADTTILPFTVIRAGARIGAHCEVGPFSHVRPGTVLADHAELGNFVEAKNARIGAHTKAKHLTYLGDVEVGARANIGAGTVICNYDGRQKHQTVIEDEVFVGSGSMIVAPRRLGRGAKTGAGAVVTHDVAPGATVVGVPARPLAPRGKDR